jgi:oxalate---CoA ligase
VESSIEFYFDLERRAVETPGGVALAAHGREPLTWADLWRHTYARSEEFVRAGIAPRSVAALALPNGPEFLTTFLAITLRAACAPLELSLTEDEYRFHLSKINAGVLVFADGVNAAVVEVARELGMRLVRIRCPHGSSAGVFLVEPAGDAVIRASPQEAAPRRETSAAVLLHTSATTNTPKLVPLSRENLRAAAEQDLRALQIGPTDRYLSLTPLCHAHGLAATLTQLYCGGGVLCDSAFSPADLLESIQKFRPTWMSAGVPVLRTLLALARDNPEAFRRNSLRFIRSTGGSPDPELLDAFQQIVGVPLLNGYGLTEVPGVTRNTLSMSRPGSAGKSSGAKLAIRDEAGNFLPAEAEGEIVLRGPALTSGYLDDPQANQEAFRDGWFHTGDIGRIDRDGFLFIAGRKKEMISRGGKKILPLEVDSVLLRHPALADAATFPIPHRTLEQEPAAAVVLRPGAKVSELEVRRFAAKHLADYKVPRKIVFLDQIPRATGGKPRRAALTEQFRKLGSPAHSPQLDPPSEIEETLIAIWRRNLGVEHIATGDDFFDLGGDSLSAAHMLTEAAASFELGQGKLPEADFFDQPTIAALARSIAERAREIRGEPALENRILVLESDGSRIPIFCFSTSEQDAYQFRHLSRWLGPEQPFTVVCPSHPVQQDRLRTVEEIARQSITSIRALRPRGPYVIGGHCYGGVVAFEAARQLIAEGESIAMLVLFDTPTPGYPKITAAWKRYPQAAGGMLSAWLGGKKPVTLREIGAHIGVLTRIAAKRIGMLAPRTLYSTDSGSLRPQAWHRALMNSYQPRVIAVPIAHFIGAGVTMNTRILSDPRMGWRHFAGAGFEARSVAGDHVSIFDESHAPELAAELEGILQGLHHRTAAAFA